MIRMAECCRFFIRLNGGGGMGKMNLTNVYLKYFATLVDARTEKICYSDVGIQVVAPLVGGAAFFACWPLDPQAVDSLSTDVITAVSIISALLCGVAVMIFQLRLQLTSSDGPIPTSDESKLIDELFNEVLWAVLCGFGTVLLLALRAAAPMGTDIWKIDISLSVALMINFVMATSMCIKRLSAAYEMITKNWAPRH